jgi:hypothetical protein
MYRSAGKVSTRTPLGERLHRHHCLGCGSRRLRRVGTYAGFTVVYAVGTEPPQDGYSKGWPSNGTAESLGVRW